MLEYALYILGAAYIAAYILMPGFKKRWRGNRGEARVARLLRRLNISYLTDLRVHGSNGRIYQIDLIAWVDRNFYVIEVKNFGGVIYGRSEDKEWTQKFRRSQWRFYNPIYQNYGHVKAMRENLPTVDGFKSIVVFVGRARFPHGRPYGVYDFESLRSHLLHQLSGFPQGTIPGHNEAHVVSPSMQWTLIRNLNADRAARRSARIVKIKKYAATIWSVLKRLF